MSTSILVSLLVSCAGFAAPRAETLAMLPTDATTPDLHGRFETTVETPVLSGVYETVLVVEPGIEPRAPRVRLQLFPDIGGKLLELEIDHRAISGQIATTAPWTCPLPIPAGTPPNLLMILGLALRERFGPIVADRVLGERRDRDTIELSLRPITPGGQVAVRLDLDGRAAEWVLDYGWLHVTIDVAGTLRAHDSVIHFAWSDLVAAPPR